MPEDVSVKGTGDWIVGLCLQSLSMLLLVLKRIVVIGGVWLVWLTTW